MNQRLGPMVAGALAGGGIWAADLPAEVNSPSSSTTLIRLSHDATTTAEVPDVDCSTAIRVD
jgi:hypothetical protein